MSSLRSRKSLAAAHAGNEQMVAMAMLLMTVGGSMRAEVSVSTMPSIEREGLTPLK